MSRQKTLDFEMIFESTPVACLVLTPELTIVAASNRYLAVVMATHKDIVGRALFDVHLPNPADPQDDGMRALRVSLDRVLLHRVADTMAVQCREIPRPDGQGIEARYWRATNAPVLSPNGQVLYIVHHLDDVTEYVHLQQWAREHEERARQLGLQAESLKREMESCAQDVAARAAEMTRSNTELEQFAYAASHDLQEPLRMVSSYVQLLAHRYHGRLGQDADDFITYALDGAKRMQTLIADLLRFSRIGTQGKPFVPTSLDAVLDRALASLRHEIEETKASVTRDALPVVQADEIQMAQVFQNLIGNALKFHGEASPRIHIGYEHCEHEHLVSVQDNGIGIEPQYLERIFMIFQRLHTRAEYSGTGVGLALCKRVVERHHGRIWAESIPAQGSAFYFTIPDREGNPS